MWLETDFPLILGAELYRPSPTYVAELAIEPSIVHDFGKQPGQTVQLDRYNYWGNPGSKESRRRTADQTIGTASSRSVTKQKVLVTLDEFTGPADSTDPDQPSTFKVSRQNLMTAQRMLFDTGNIGLFHNSIGSMTLLNDYRQWRDRVFLLELYKSYSRGKADSTQGGYYFPGQLSENELTVPGYDITTAGATDRAKFSVKEDLLQVVKDLGERHVPRYMDGYYRCLCDPTFMMHMRQDSDFREIARYSGNGIVNPMAPYTQPNASNYLGMGPAYGQAGSVGGSPAMPTGFLFEGVRFFESTNFPNYSHEVAINGARGFTGNTPKECPTAVGMFFGMQGIGVGIGGQNAQVLINNNDDFSRYIILIWALYAGFEVLNYDFTTVAHSFQYSPA
jgi:hypothetical protein